MRFNDQQQTYITLFGAGLIIGLLIAIGVIVERFNEHLIEYEAHIATSPPAIIINIGE